MGNYRHKLNDCGHDYSVSQHEWKHYETSDCATMTRRLQMDNGLVTSR